MKEKGLLLFIAIVILFAVVYGGFVLSCLVSGLNPMEARELIAINRNLPVVIFLANWITALSAAIGSLIVLLYTYKGKVNV